MMNTNIDWDDSLQDEELALLPELDIDLECHGLELGDKFTIAKSGTDEVLTMTGGEYDGDYRFIVSRQCYLMVDNDVHQVVQLMPYEYFMRTMKDKEGE